MPSPISKRAALQPTVRPSRGQIRAHTGLRGIAALLVVAYHLQFGKVYRLPFESSTFLFKRSYLMVDLFFILSGFIISYVYRADRRARFTWAETKSFLFSRFARIYPLHFVTMLYLLLFAVGSSALLSLVGHQYQPLSAKSFTDWLLQLLLLNAWIPGYVAWNIPSWSISAEMFAYALFPAIVALHLLRPRLTYAALITTSLAFYVYIAVTSGSLDIVAGLAPLRCIAGFSVGMLLYHFRALPARAPSAILSWLQLIAVAWASLALANRVSDPLVIPAFALIVATTWPDRGIVAAAIRSHPFEWLGEISYSVYLLHVPLGTTLGFFFDRIEPRLGVAPQIGRTLWLVLIYSVVLAGATLSYRFIEAPARRALLRWRGSAKHQLVEGAIAAP